MARHMLILRTAGLSLLLALSVQSSVAPRPKHVFAVLVDDLGWADIGINRAIPTDEVNTPNIDALVSEGIHLTRHMVYKFCTPTRSAAYSGRIPVHVQTSLANPDKVYAGIPRNMTGIGVKMQQAGYKTHHVGKWDAGMATPMHTPQGRGFQTSLSYFTHKNDYWTQKDMQSGCKGKYNITDLWGNGQPAYGVNGTDYEEFLFQKHMLDTIAKHDPNEPLFLWYAPHVAHCPLQVPEPWFDKFNFMRNDEDKCAAQTPYTWPGQQQVHGCRQIYHSFVHLMDSVIGNVTQALKDKGMWNETFMIFSSDNGGPVDLAENAANNYPLRGGKYSTFSGGVTAAAFVAGGALPPAVRGTTNNGLMSIADWYTTFCGFADVDPYDALAASSGLPAVDGIDMWTMLSTPNTPSPRTELAVAADCFVQGNYTLVTGKQSPGGWQSPVYPNSTSQDSPSFDCGEGCLFDVVSDPAQHHDLASSMPKMVESMKARLQALSANFYSNSDDIPTACPASITDDCACWMAETKYGGYFGPFAEVLSPPAPPSPPSPPTSTCHLQLAPIVSGAAVVMCAQNKSEPRQLWYITADNTIHLQGLPELCLTAAGKTATGNEDVLLTDCTQTANQQWNLQADGRVTVNSSGLCLDVQKSNTTFASDGNVETYACHNHPGTNQYFELIDGRLIDSKESFVVQVI